MSNDPQNRWPLNARIEFAGSYYNRSSGSLVAQPADQRLHTRSSPNLESQLFIRGERGRSWMLSGVDVSFNGTPTAKPQVEILQVDYEEPNLDFSGVEALNIIWPYQFNLEEGFPVGDEGYSVTYPPKPGYRDYLVFNLFNHEDPFFTSNAKNANIYLPLEISDGSQTRYLFVNSGYIGYMGRHGGRGSFLVPIPSSTVSDTTVFFEEYDIINSPVTNAKAAASCYLLRVPGHIPKLSYFDAPYIDGTTNNYQVGPNHSVRTYGYGSQVSGPISYLMPTSDRQSFFVWHHHLESPGAYTVTITQEIEIDGRLWLQRNILNTNVDNQIDALVVFQQENKRASQMKTPLTEGLLLPVVGSIVDGQPFSQDRVSIYALNDSISANVVNEFIIPFQNQKQVHRFILTQEQNRIVFDPPIRFDYECGFVVNVDAPGVDVESYINILGKCLTI